MQTHAPHVSIQALYRRAALRTALGSPYEALADLSRAVEVMKKMEAPSLLVLGRLAERVGIVWPSV